MTSTIRYMRVRNDSLMNALKTVNNKRFMKAGYLGITKGSYDNFPAELKTEFIGDGGLIVEGLGTPNYETALAEVDSVTDLGDGEGCVIGYSGTPFDANAFQGMWLRVMVGDGAGALYPIYKNTTSAIYIGENLSVSAITAGDFTRVCTPPVEITVDHTLGMDFSKVGPTSDGSAYDDSARVQFSGINFIFDGLDVDYEEVFKVLSNNCPVRFTFCTITLSNEKQIVSFPLGGNINSADLADCLTGIQAITLYDTMTPGLLIDPDGIPTATPANILVGNGAKISHVSCRGSIKTSNEYSDDNGFAATIKNCQVGGYVRKGGNVYSEKVYIEPCAATEYPYDAVQPCDRLKFCYIADGKNAIRQKGGDIQADTVETASDVTDYDLEIVQQGTFTNVGDSCTFAATTGDIYFTEKASDNAVAHPAQGAIATDSLGSTVLNSQ